MTDVLSSVASVVTILGCAIESTKSLLVFFHDFREAPADVQLWVQRLESIQITLNALQECNRGLDLQALSPRLCQNIGECANHLGTSASKIGKIAARLNESKPRAKKRWNHESRKAWERIKWTAFGSQSKRKMTEIIGLYQVEFSLELFKIMMTARGTRSVEAGTPALSGSLGPSEQEPTQSEIHEFSNSGIQELPSEPVPMRRAPATYAPEVLVHSLMQTYKHNDHRPLQDRLIQRFLPTQAIRSSLACRWTLLAVTLTARGGSLIDPQTRSGRSSYTSKGHGPAGFGVGLSLGSPRRCRMRIEVTFKIAIINRNRYRVHWNLDFIRVVPDHSPVFESARRGSVDEVKAMFAAGKATAKDVTRFGITLLHIASKPGNEEVVQLLIDEGAEINAADEDGETPLHRALEFNKNYNVARKLIENGADLANKTTDGGTPLHNLFSDTIAEVVSKDFGIEATATNSQGMSTSHFFAQSSRTTLDVFRKGRQFDLVTLWSRDNLGRTCLHFAVSAGNLSILPYLLDQASSAEIKRRDFRGRQPLHYAAQSSRAVQVIDMLVDRGCDLYAVDEMGQTAMYWAAYWRQIDAAKRLAALDLEKRQVQPRKDGQFPWSLVSMEEEPVMYEFLKSLDPSKDAEIRTVVGRPPVGSRRIPSKVQIGNVNTVILSMGVSILLLLIALIIKHRN